jgi:hypothetical protein
MNTPLFNAVNIRGTSGRVSNSFYEDFQGGFERLKVALICATR